MRIDKLLHSSPVKIKGDEFEITNDYKINKSNALKYGRQFIGLYINKDTNQHIYLLKGRTNGGINGVLQHNYKDVPHLKSVAIIPQIIEQSIYIESQPNRDSEKIQI